MLRLPQKVNATNPGPGTKSDRWASPNSAPAMKSDMKLHIIISTSTSISTFIATPTTTCSTRAHTTDTAVTISSMTFAARTTFLLLPELVPFLLPIVLGLPLLFQCRPGKWLFQSYLIHLQISIKAPLFYSFFLAFCSVLLQYCLGQQEEYSSANLY